MFFEFENPTGQSFELRELFAGRGGEAKGQFFHSGGGRAGESGLRLSEDFGGKFPVVMKSAFIFDMKAAKSVAVSFDAEAFGRWFGDPLQNLIWRHELEPPKESGLLSFG